MGDPKHDGLHEAQVRSRGDKNCDRSEKGKKTPKQPEGTSGRKDLSNLQRAELAHPASRESWQSETGDRGKVLAEEVKKSSFPQDQKKPNTNGSPREQLSPNWVEALMGLTIGMTDLGSWGTECSPQPQN